MFPTLDVSGTFCKLKFPFHLHPEFCKSFWSLPEMTKLKSIFISLISAFWLYLSLNLCSTKSPFPNHHLPICTFLGTGFPYHLHSLLSRLPYDLHQLCFSLDCLMLLTPTWLALLAGREHPLLNSGLPMVGILVFLYYLWCVIISLNVRVWKYMDRVR